MERNITDGGYWRKPYRQVETRRRRLSAVTGIGVAGGGRGHGQGDLMLAIMAASIAKYLMRRMEPGSS
jgi:hypothetical protein